MRVEITNPLAGARDTSKGVEIRYGPHRDGENEFSFSPSSHFPPTDLDDGVVIRLQLEGQHAFRVLAFRGLTSSFELFYRRTAEGSLLLTDHFRTAAAAIPAEERTVPQNAIIDQMLFRTCPGHSTLFAGIARLGHGELLDWDCRSRRIKVRLATRLERHPNSERNAREAVTGVLERLMRRYSEQPAPANMLSGGVDSTLLQTFLPRGHPSVSAAIDVPEYEFETEYARRASVLTRSSHSLVPVVQERYMDHLESCIDNSALPPHHLQSVLFDRVFADDNPGYLTAQLADALFGLERARWASLARLGKMIWNQPVIGSILVRQVSRFGERGRSHAALLRQLRRGAEDPFGFASQYALYSDIPTVVRLFGTDAVAGRLSARLEYTEERLTGEAPHDLVDAHLELGQLLDFFCDDGVSIWRQLAHGHGKYLDSPFTSRELVESSFLLPARDRYARFGNEKRTLKDILVERLPEYPVDQPKGASGFPFQRLYPTGPLRHVFDRYGRPGFLDADAANLCDRGHDFCWNVLAYTVWSSRIAAGSSIEPPAAAIRREWQIGPGFPEES